MKLRALLITTALLAAPVAMVQAQTETAPAANSAPAATAPMQVTDPAQFAAMAASSNQFEIASSTLAVERSTNQDVVAFAEQMIADHTNAAQQMMPAAEEEGITPPTDMEDRHQQMVDELEGLEGEEFDAAYIAAQVQAHDEAVALFQSYSSEGPDGPLKEFATATLPVLEQHQEHVHGLSGNH